LRAKLMTFADQSTFSDSRKATSDCDAPSNQQSW
jgi:hypothetical protein